jgi:hypothetical protein
MRTRRGSSGVKRKRARHLLKRPVETDLEPIAPRPMKDVMDGYRDEP